jgi:polyisoprenoid-binding protein YceI
MKHFALPIAFVFPLMLVSSALAQHQTLTINPDASEVKMTLKTNHDVVNGTFHVQSGSIAFDNKLPNLSGSVVVAAGSGKTGNDSRDKKMDKDVLNTEKYTTVSFTPKTYTGAIAASGDSTIQVTGTFTLLDVPHEITLPMQIHIDGGNCTAKAHFPVPYVQWGLKDPSFFMFKTEKVVDIDLSLSGHLSN